jgi:hypothetical protein
MFHRHHAAFDPPCYYMPDINTRSPPCEAQQPPRQIAESLTELWSPRIVGELDDSYMEVAKMHGALGWHSHDNEDARFFILKELLRKQAHGGYRAVRSLA